MILFTADWHIKLGQRNVPSEWAKKRYFSFFEQVHAIPSVDLHIIGGDIFDRVPTLEELSLLIHFIKHAKVPTIIYDGNHEATRKGKTFLTHLKELVSLTNPLVSIVDSILVEQDYVIVPYGYLHELEKDKVPFRPYLFTHVRGEIPPHVKPEIDLDSLDKYELVFAGDLHSHSNTQRNIVYPGSPMTTSFHRGKVETGYILIDDDWSWKWKPFNLPQLIRKTVSSQEEMVPTDFDHTIYEIEGDLSELSTVKNSELLDKKIIKRENSTSNNIFTRDSSISEEVSFYLKEVLKLESQNIEELMGVLNDYTEGTGVE